MDNYQRKIVGTKRRYVEVSAAPGSGKTHTLLGRVQQLRETVPAEQIVVLSFSNESVGELRKRIKAMSTDCFTNVTVCTTHALALKYTDQKSVLSEKRAIELVGQAIRAVRRDCQKSVLWTFKSESVKQRRMAQLDELLTTNNIKRTHSLLTFTRASRQKVSESVTGQFKSLVPYVSVLTAIRNKYKVIKKDNAVVDFGDMLANSAKNINGGVSIPFTHILVDEFQDCSAAQTHLITVFAKLEGRSLMVFGDLYQGIYGFAGANHTPLSSVLDNVHQMSLPVSRRLTSQTATLASAVAGLKGKKAIQTNRDGAMPILVCDKTQSEQTEKIVQHILKLINQGVEPSEIALLGRTKALLHPVEQLLLGHDVQTNRMGYTRHTKHALRVLKLVSIVYRCEKDNAKVLPERLIKAFPFIAGVDDEKWKKQATDLNKVARTPSLGGRYIKCAKIYLRLNDGIRADAERRADVNRWEAKCNDFKTAKSMRLAIRAMRVEKVVTGTIHAAKGREWKHVLVVGATDGLLPIHFAKDEHSIEQERNMMYVAITRAIDTVRLYHAPSNYARGRKTFEDVSRFLATPDVRKCFSVE